MHVSRCLRLGVVTSICLGVAFAASNGPAALAEPWNEPFVVAQSDAAEIDFWRSVKDTDDPRELEAYLDAWPEGDFAPLARLRIEKLRRASTARSEDVEENAGEQAEGDAQEQANEDTQPSPPIAYRDDEKGYLGIEVINLTQEMRSTNNLEDFMGAEILSVVPGTAAARAGVQVGDVIRSLAGQRIRSQRELVSTAQSLRPGTQATAEIVRYGERLELDVTIGGAVTDLSRSAESGNPAAAVMLGRLYAAGGAVEEDTEKAAELFRQATRQSNAEAFYHLGVLYFRGYGGSNKHQRYGKAKDLFSRAAASEHPGAVTMLGYYAANGLAGRRNYRQAADYYEQAAALGNATAKGNLAGILLDGRTGVAKDFDRAVDLFRQAALSRVQFAVDALKERNLDVYTPVDIQRMLSDVGLYSGSLDGKIGDETRSAIRAFQRLIGEPETGEVTLALAQRLFLALHPSGKD